MKVQIKNLLIRLQQSNSETEKRKIRKRLRVIGHRQGLRGCVLKLKKPKQLTDKEKKKIKKHNLEVSRRISTKKYKPFQRAEK